MTIFFRFIKSDFLKMKRQPILLLHLLLPLLGIILFIGYFSYAPYKSTAMVMAFLQMMAIVFPILIAIVCSMAVEQESSPGDFQQMLTSWIKMLPFFSKLLVVLLLGLSAILLLVCGFGAGFIYILHKSPFELGYYLYVACIFFGSSIFLYVLHLIVSLKFGNMVSIGIGIFESLLSALFITGLGDNKWEFMPCAWGIRFSDIFSKYMSGGISLEQNLSELHLGICLCITGSIAITVFGLIWFLHWEGRKSGN